MKFSKGNETGKMTRFKPGKSGNPNGLPKGYKSYKKRMAEMAGKMVDFKALNELTKKGGAKKRMKAGEALIIAIYGKALFKQDMQAARLILEATQEFDLLDMVQDQFVDGDCIVVNDEPQSLKDLTDEQYTAFKIIADIYAESDQEPKAEKD